MKIKTKIYLIFIVYLILLVILGSALNITARQKVHSIEKSDLASDMVQELFGLNVLTNDYILYQSERAKEQWQKVYASLGDIIAHKSHDEKKMKHTHTHKEESILHEMHENYTLIGELFPKITHPSISKELRDRLVSEILIKSQDMVVDAFELTHISQRTILKAQTRDIIFNLVFLSSMFVLVVIGFYTLISSALKPIKNLVEGTERIGEGDLTYKIEIKDKNEFGDLAAAFNQMTKNLEQTTASRDELDKEIAERKRAMEEIEKLAKFPDENPNPILRISKDGTVLYHNKGSELLLEQWQYREGKPLPEKWFKLVGESFKNNEVKTEETKIADKVFSLTFAPIIEKEFVNVYGLDITESKRAEDALRESEEKYRDIVENIADVIFILNKEGIVIYISQNIQNIIGYTAEDTIDENFAKYVYSEDLEISIEGFEKHKKGSIVPQEFRMITKKGETKWVSVLGKLAKNKKNECVFSGVLRDISERKRAMEEIEKLAKFPDENPNPVLRISKDGIVLYHNIGSELLLEQWQYEEEQPIPEKWSTLVRQSFETNEVKIEETTIDDKVLTLTFAPIIEKDFVNVYGLDITERKRVEAELKVSRERLKTASSILRHDLTNDLTVIKSAVDIYREERDESMIDEIEKRVEKSIETIHHQRDQIQFLDSHAELDEYDLKEVVQKVVSNYPDLKITVTGNCVTYADNAIYSVFDNIVNNAVRHGKTSKLDIEIIPNLEHCEIRFKDYGIGIPDEIKDKIFDEGFHYGETGHTGIGLYIVQTTIEEYGGMVFVEDNTPQGAVFIIRLKKAIEG
jgi:PAS domain S-box-containing protein